MRKSLIQSIKDFREVFKEYQNDKQVKNGLVIHVDFKGGKRLNKPTKETVKELNPKLKKGA